ncbi:Response regulator of the competence regulon ComE [Streptococcus mitis]|uniref:Response regulator of the competence regulon ComE n=1 Tax=Streptococcus mitis TaxID=28037 RepID=A0A139PLH2_STRMT|nr:Response regulator of the competence regulon ComE [Streptococcus mitis]
MVSLQAIEEMTATEVTLLEGLHFPVSRTARRTLKKHLNV